MSELLHPAARQPRGPQGAGSLLRPPAICLLVAVAACSDAQVQSGNRPPQVQLLDPAEGAVVAFGEDRPFCLRVADPDPAHTVDQLALLLTSSAQGVLWNGEPGEVVEEGCQDGAGNVLLSGPPLVEGPHTVAAFVWDGEGGSGESSHSLTVERPADQVPTCSVVDPPQASEVFADAPLVFAAAVEDADDGPGELAVMWGSSLAGDLGAGTLDAAGFATLGPLELAAGAHYISLRVTDPRGEIGACGVPLTVIACVDADGDGFENCGGDCDDGDATSFPGAPETSDGADNDCDGVVDDGTALVDDDGDGFAEWQGDCDDADPGVAPLAAEVPDGVDQDCDGRTDEGTSLADDDGDGACEGPTACTDGSIVGDCDDSDPSLAPGAPERLCDGLDQPCNGLSTDAPDADGDGFDPCEPADAGDTDGATADCDDSSAARSPAQPEVLCSALDDDCDGTTEDAPDADGDGFDPCAPTDAGDGDGFGADCDDGDPTRAPLEPEIADGIDQDCDGVVDEGTSWFDDDGDSWSEVAGDCDDTNPLVSPGRPELPNQVDDDCDTLVDEGTVLYDDDGDGFGEVQFDCDDADPTRWPGAPEVPDGVDQDCDGRVDDGTVAYDDDLDGQSELGGDCDDADPTVGPAAYEAPDGEDDDCDGIIDEGTALFDDDGDLYTEVAGDCDDGDSDRYPGAPEDGGSGLGVGDGIDSDCDGFVDEGTLGYDDDGDSWPELLGDCDDADDSVSPGAPELCGNGIDDDCEGTVDQPDEDGDGAIDDLCGGTDCDDADATTHPGATEVFDTADNDCDDAWDEGYISAGMIVVTEIMKDPVAVSDAFGEWFEVLNPGAADINLHGWTIRDDGGNSFVVGEDLIVDGGGRAVLGTWDDAGANGGYIPDFTYNYASIGGMQLGNGADEIVLLQGVVLVDRVDWLTSGWPDPAGSSMVLGAAFLSAVANDAGSAWCVATTPMPAGDDGTPGMPGGC